MAEAAEHGCREQPGYFVARNFFPTEKKVRHPIRANYNIGDDVFVRTMGHLLGPSLVEGNKVTPLENGDQIFPAMLSGIRSAQRTITFENFLFQEGEISDAFAQALAERARAGVKVHFLQDALGCDSVHGRAIKLMKRAGSHRSPAARIASDHFPLVAEVRPTN